MEIKEDINQLLQARSEIDAELRRHKTRQTILFTDIVGSTTYFDRFGDTAGLLLLYRHDSLVIGAVQEFHGTVVKTIGDSVMAEFAEPLSAILAATAIQQRLLEHNKGLAREERLQIRIGINTGYGFRRDNDLFGDAVNVAARITKRSGPAQILASHAVLESIPPAQVTFKSLGKINLEGKTELEELFEVIWTEASVYDALRSSLADLSNSRVSASHGEELDEFVQTSSVWPAGDESSKEMPLPAALAERYEIQCRLGAGGMGVVYKARDKETGETVALKVLNPEIADRAPLMEVFRNEIRVARKITHKNVCRIYDFARTEGTAFISMEFVQGETLRRVLDRFSALTTRTGIKVALEICDALHEVHIQGIVHRDVKPQNLMIDESGNVKLMDFGLAHFVHDGSTAAAGTPSYMAPEQAKRSHVDQRADIYSLGLVLFEMFTGAAVFAGNTPLVHALKQQYESSPDPNTVERHFPEYIGRAILRCLEKDPAKRFQSVDELRVVLNSDPAKSQPDEPDSSDGDAEGGSVMTTLARYLGMRRVKAALILVPSLMLAAGIIVSMKRPVVKDTPVQQKPVEAIEAAEQEKPTDAPLPEQASRSLPAPQQASAPFSPPQPQVGVQSSPPKAVLPPPPAPTAVKQVVLAKADKSTKSASAEITPSSPPAPLNHRSNWMSLIETVAIPAGTFKMGDEAGKKDEKPSHPVKLDAFQMSRGEITNRQYLAFLEATSYSRPKDPSFAKNYLNDFPDLPVVNVSYDDALAFCAWASAKFGAAFRLPTEAEWEYAANAGREVGPFAWGAGDPKAMARFKGNAPHGVAVVSKDAFPANGFGLYNMSGNVWEWVHDYYSKDYYLTSPIRNPKGPAAGSKRSIRGGSWADDDQALWTTRRANRGPDERSDQVGFRVVVATEP